MSKIDKPRCPQCGAYLTLVPVGYSTAYVTGLAKSDYECTNPKCVLNKRV